MNSRGEMTNHKRCPTACANVLGLHPPVHSAGVTVASHSRSRRCVSLLASCWLLHFAVLVCHAENAQFDQRPHPACARCADNGDEPRTSVTSRSGSLMDDPLLVVGFMGGRVKPGNTLHSEVLLARQLQRSHQGIVHTAVFANHNAPAALQAVLRWLDTNGDGALSIEEKRAARIVLYGHSWGASEAVAFADQLNSLQVPVLLTIQVDSVQKAGEDDARIPPNVGAAINFYQAEGFLHGQAVIYAADPKRTAILGNYESFYRHAPVSCVGYPWYARLLMKEHIEIENDPQVWGRIRALINSLIGSTPEQMGSSAHAALTEVLPRRTAQANQIQKAGR